MATTQRRRHRTRNRPASVNTNVGACVCSVYIVPRLCVHVCMCARRFRYNREHCPATRYALQRHHTTSHTLHSTLYGSCVAMPWKMCFVSCVHTRHTHTYAIAYGLAVTSTTTTTTTNDERLTFSTRPPHVFLYMIWSQRNDADFHRIHRTMHFAAAASSTATAVAVTTTTFVDDGARPNVRTHTHMSTFYVCCEYTYSSSRYTHNFDDYRMGLLKCTVRELAGNSTKSIPDCMQTPTKDMCIRCAATRDACRHVHSNTNRADIVLDVLTYTETRTTMQTHTSGRIRRESFINRTQINPNQFNLVCEGSASVAGFHVQINKQSISTLFGQFFFFWLIQYKFHFPSTDVLLQIHLHKYD